MMAVDICPERVDALSEVEFHGEDERGELGGGGAVPERGGDGLGDGVGLVGGGGRVPRVGMDGGGGYLLSLIHI